jgi:hypothetical protein
MAGPGNSVTCIPALVSQIYPKRYAIVVTDVLD